MLWRIPDFIRNRRWSGLSTRFTGLGLPRHQRKTFNHFGRSHGRNRSKSGFIIYEKESPQKHQRHVHRSESVSSRKTPYRTISLNAHYMVVFKNPRDVSQIMALAHQMYPRRTQFFLEAFARATARPHGYMVIDMKQNTPDILRLRTFIFPGENRKRTGMSSHEKDVTPSFLPLLHQMLRE